MKSNLLQREDFYFEDDYQEYLKRQIDSLDYWSEIDQYVGEALNEYRNDKKSYNGDWE